MAPREAILFFVLGLLALTRTPVAQVAPKCTPQEVQCSIGVAVVWCCRSDQICGGAFPGQCIQNSEDTKPQSRSRR